MNLMQLRLLVAIVETGSFTAAAAAFRMTQSAVSHAIAGLERELGVVLLDRTRQGIAVTEAGEHALAHARAILAHLEELQDEVAASSRLAGGKIRIGSFPSVTAGILPGILGPFHRRYPGVETVVLEGSDAEVVEWIRSRAVDVGVVTLPADGLDAMPLAVDRMLAVVPSAHPFADLPMIRAADLADEPFIMSTAGCEPLILACFRDAGCLPRVRFRVGDVNAILAMVREGLGVTIIPELAVPPAEGLCALPLDPPAMRHLGFAVRSLAGASPAVRAFLEQARQAIPADPEAGSGAPVAVR